MGKRIQFRPFTILLLVAMVVLIIAYQSSLRGPDIPSNARLKLPTGPVTPMVSMGATHGLIVAGDGSLWSWGTNFAGWPVLGLGTNETQPYLQRIGTNTDWASVNAGHSHSIAIKSDGSLWAWGQNIYGQFGNGTKGAPRSVATPVPGAPGNDWKQAAAGGSHTIALKKDGTMWAWGLNSFGQLGIGVTNDTTTPAQIGSATNWVRIWAEWLNGAALQSDGSLWVWGDNPALISQVSGTSNLFAPVRISADTNWVDATFGSDALLAIKSDGTLWVWGRGARSYNGAKDSRLDATPTRVGTNDDWRSINSSAYGYYHLLTKKDGSLWALRAFPMPHRLARIDLPKGFAALSATGRNGIGVVLARDGEVWTWGLMLGENTRAHPAFQKIATIVRKLGGNVHWGEPQPVVREKPWLLPNIDPDAPK